ncbi:MAG TPA: ACT domain-containing protein [Roseiflexaceae bacterium]|nr:ACT domain-containing protein [Roseiflexaceae bacterium]
MNYHDPRIAHILNTMHWRVRPERFVLAGIDAHDRPVVLRVLSGIEAPFYQMISEPGTVTLVLPQEEWRRIAPAFPHAAIEQPFRVIAFEIDLPPDLVGFMALISATLAQEQVSLLAVCSYARDYVLVRERDLERAQRAITRLTQGKEQRTENKAEQENQ